MAISLARAFSEPRRADARRSCVGMRTFAGEIATFAMDERMCTRSGGRQPPVARGNASAAAWRNCSGDIRPTHWRAPAQSRYSHTHGGLTRGALVSGESPPACAWRFPLHACSPNHGGLTPAALVPGESPSACGLRFPLPVRSFEPGSANTLLCTAEVAFSSATEWRTPEPRFSVNGSSVAPDTEVALKRLEMAVIGQVEMQRGNGDVAFSQGGDIRVGRGL